MKQIIRILVNLVLGVMCARAVVTVTAGEAGVSLPGLRTFCSIGKERPNLNGYGEAELMRQSGKGCMTHMWFGGDWPAK